jgi:hypothetical protein
VREVLALMLVAACGRFDFDGRAHDAANNSDAMARDGNTAIGSDADVEPACLADYAICDGFEGTDFEPVWTVSSNATLDATVAHRGVQSLHVHTDAIAASDGVNLGVVESSTFGDATEPLYIRAFVRFGSIPVDHMGVIEVSQTSAPAPNTDGVFETATGLVVYSQFTNTSDDTMLQPTLDAWTCLVFEIIRASDNTGKLALTGDDGGELDSVQTDGTPPLGELQLGIAFASSTDSDFQPALDLWIDDVIVANAPVSCAD